VKLLLDEQLPRQLAQLFPSDYEVRTVGQMGWLGSTNGVLLSKAIDAEFTALITADKNIKYQQNPGRLGLPVLVLDAGTTRVQDLAPLLPVVVSLLGNNPSPGVYNIVLD